MRAASAADRSRAVDVRVMMVNTLVTFMPRFSAAPTIASWAAARKCGYVCACNVHMLMEANVRPALRRALNGATAVLPDGMPLVWLAFLAGCRSAARVAGPDLLESLCGECERQRIPVGLLGGTAECQKKLLNQLVLRWPKLKTVFAETPSYEDGASLDDPECATRIREAGVALLLVGLGCPKQEIWMQTNAPGTQCLAVGLGAAFDFTAGIRPRAPRVLRWVGLEWAFRLCCEPRRLWRRYAITNASFLREVGTRTLLGRTVAVIVSD